MCRAARTSLAWLAVLLSRCNNVHHANHRNDGAADADNADTDDGNNDRPHRQQEKLLFRIN